MTQEQKDLLLKDLCSRLPYGVKVQDELGRIHKLVLGNSDLGRLYYNDFSTYSENKLSLPCLFPLSSMTEEQKYDFYCRFIENDCDFDDFKEFYLDNGMWHKLLTSLDDIEAIIDWFHKNHFDYRGLIPLNLAIDTTGKNIY